MSLASDSLVLLDDWQAVQDEWVTAVNRFIDDAERWSRTRDWDTRRQARTHHDPAIGTYDLPRLLIHNGIGRVLLAPISRHVVGVEGGAIDMLSVPDYDGILIVREWAQWSIYECYRNNQPDRIDADLATKPWTEEVFATAVDLLARP